MDDLCDMSSTLSKSALFPVPQDWDASKSELASLRDFYSQMLGVKNATYRTILDVLENREFDAPLDPSDLWLTDDFYRALDKLRRKLSPHDSAKLRYVALLGMSPLLINTVMIGRLLQRMPSLLWLLVKASYGSTLVTALGPPN